MARSMRYRAVVIDPSTGWAKSSSGRWTSRVEAFRIAELWERHGTSNVRVVDERGNLTRTSERDPGRRARRDPKRAPTPGYNSRLQIGFTTDKYGRPIAYYWSRSGMGRWIRMSLEKARLFVAQDEADQIPYTGPWKDYFASMRAKETDKTSNDVSKHRRRRIRR